MKKMRDLFKNIISSNKRQRNSGFTPLEKATDKVDGGKNIATDGGLMPPSAETVRERSSLTGFTLVEMIITNVVLIFIIGAFTFVVFVCMRNWDYQRQNIDLREPAANSLDIINQDLRRARTITTAALNSVTFTVSPYETITYSRVLGGSGVWQLVRTYALSTTPATSISSPISMNVNSFTLAYYNSAGTALTVPVVPAQLANIRLVRVTLVNQSTLLLFTDSVTVRAQVRPRNM